MRKKQFALLLAMMASISLSKADIYSGTCGKDLIWSLNTVDSTLVITGSGEFEDWNGASEYPWFEYRENIANIILPNGLSNIGDNAFRSCKNLLSVTIPNSVTSIGDYAFRECFNLTYLTIGNHVTSIGGYAFYHCSRLTSVTIPNSVTSIGSSAFYFCTGLTSVTISNSVTSIGSSAFAGCTGLTSLTIPNSVTIIGDEAFSSCSGLTSLTIPNSVTSIWNRAFYDCTGLTSVTISDSITDIKDGVFEGCTGLTSLTIPNSVTSIGGYAFASCTGLTSLTIPNSVTSIGNRAFYNCTGLTSVTISDSVTDIKDGVFEGCTGLMAPIYIADIFVFLPISFSGSYTIPNGIKSIVGSAFAGCRNLLSVTIPNSVTSIGNSAFVGCSSLTSVTIPNSVTSIGNSAFNGCSSLSSVTIPNSVTSIKNRAFAGCSSLTSVTIPNSVDSIGFSAFEHCYNLTMVTVGDGIKDIEGYAFNTENLRIVRISATTPPQTHEASFGWSPSKITAFVPPFSLDAYKNSDGWKKMNIQVNMNDLEVSPTGCLISFGQDSSVASIGISGEEQQPGNVLEYTGLEPNTEYTDIQVALTSNTGETDTINVAFTTSALELTTLPAKPVSSTTAILLAETNMSDAELSCGFEYKRNDAPADMSGTKVYCPVASGQMAGRLKNLKDDVYYKYRAFYQSTAGNTYYGDWQYIFTGDVTVEFDPILYTYGATVVQENEATISGYALAGSEDFTEQGFEYWAESRVNGQNNAPQRMAAAIGEHKYAQASGIKMSVTLTDLDEGTVYKYRAYGKTGNQFFYGSEQTFTTPGVYQGSETGIDEVPSDQVQNTKAQKILREGQIYILYNGTMYNVQGQKVK